jgi:glutamyl-tRNA reductase
MSVVVVGLEHRATPLDLLEAVTVAEGELSKALTTLRHSANLHEAVVLSTCLRTEVYAVVDRFHDAVSEIQDLLAARAGVDTEDLQDHFEVRFDDDVAAHLFSVASGLESAVVGESEILGQVRRAWQRADEERVSGPVLGALFRHAVVTGKRVRSETAISRGTTSFSHAAVALAAARHPGGLGGTRAVVAGAGVMGAGVLRALAALEEAERPAGVVVVSRHRASAEGLVGSVPGLIVEAADLVDLPGLIAGADVLFSALEVEAAVLGREELAPQGLRRTPLTVVDLGVPRNLTLGVRELPSVTVCDMDDLKASVNRAVGEREARLEEARAIVADEVHRYRLARRARGAAPVVAALRNRLEELRRSELDRRRPQFGPLDEDQWDQVDQVTRAVLNKVVHDPTVVLKDAAGTPRGERLVEALRILFDL